MNITKHTEEPRDPVKSLMEIPLAENEYKVDLEVTDRYQNYSAELLRAALLGIGVFGFLLKEVVLNEDSAENYRTAFGGQSIWFLAGLVTLAGAAAAAMIHRYISSDFITCQVRYLRLKKARDAADVGDPRGVDYEDANSKMLEEKIAARRQLDRGRLTIRLAAFLLAAGVGSMTVAFAKTVFATSTERCSPALQASTNSPAQASGHTNASIAR